MWHTPSPVSHFGALRVRFYTYAEKEMRLTCYGGVFRISNAIDVEGSIVWNVFCPGASPKLKR